MKSLIAAVAVGTVSALPVFAADLTPIYKAPAAAVSGQWYFSADGMYEHVKLPSTSLGWHNIGNTISVAPFWDIAALQTFSNNLDGGAGRGAIGYFVPNSAYRLEFGGSYLSASGSSLQLRQSQGEVWQPVLLNGAAPVAGFFCTTGGFVCTMNGTHHTAYDSWRFFGKAAYDWKWNTLTVTPSVAVFGGRTNQSQTLTQQFAQILVGGGGAINTGTYSASTHLRWSDAGARAGLDIGVPIATRLTLAASGWVGFAERHVHLTGSDANSDTASRATASAIASSNSKAVFLANIEAGVAYKATSNITVRGFAGANFDSKVPGISTPGYVGDLTAPTANTPAQINYSTEVNFCSGGGVVARF